MDNHPQKSHLLLCESFPCHPHPAMAMSGRRVCFACAYRLRQSTQYRRTPKWVYRNDQESAHESNGAMELISGSQGAATARTVLDAKSLPLTATSDAVHSQPEALASRNGRGRGAGLKAWRAIREPRLPPWPGREGVGGSPSCRPADHRGRGMRGDSHVRTPRGTPACGRRPAPDPHPE